MILFRRIQIGCTYAVASPRARSQSCTVTLTWRSAASCVAIAFIIPFRPRTAAKVHDHLPGRKCEQCGGALKDTIGESLPSDELSNAYEVSQAADLAIVLRTSLKVFLTNDLPFTTANHGKALVIVHLQRTLLDRICSLRISAKTDVVMACLLRGVRWKFLHGETFRLPVDQTTLNCVVT